MDLIKIICDAGIVGKGGAGFPTHVKVNTEVETVIANGCECEPLIHTDQHLMHSRAKEVVAALELVRVHTKAQKAFIGLKDKYVEIIEQFNDILNEYPHIELCIVENTYPAGDEQVLVFEVTGRSIPPLGIPLNVGCLVLNIATLSSIYDAYHHKKPLMEKWVTVTGCVKKPSMIQAPVGTSIKECIEFCGGETEADTIHIIGGPMMGKQNVTDADKESAVVTKTTGAIIVLPKGGILEEYASLTEEDVCRNARSCIQCRLCTELCPRYLIGHPLYPHKIMEAVAHGIEDEEILKSAMLCCGCGICELYACPMRLSPRAVNFVVKDRLRAKGYAYPDAAKTISKEHIEQRWARKLPTNRLITRIGIDDYMHIETPLLGMYEAQTVNIPLSQHIGAPAEPIVKAGDKVKKGDLIAKIQEGKLGANIHASIDGEVVSVEQSIRIKRSGA